MLVSLFLVLWEPCQAAETASPVKAAVPLGLQPPMIPSSADNTAAAYGQFLFHSKALSVDGKMSCASCHQPALGYTDSHPRAVGAVGAVGRRRVPPIFNLYTAHRFMLDGRAGSLVDQVRMPLEAPDEMAIDWMIALDRLAASPETGNAVATMPDATLNRDLVIKSLAAYVYTLVAGNSAFDRYEFGGNDTAISEDAKEGFRLFMRKGRCTGCHQMTGISAMFTDDNFHAIGIGFADGKYADDGRYEATHDTADRGAFKTPTLRNVALRPYLMHDGSMTSLRAVLDYYNRGGNRGAPNLDPRIQPLHLSETEIGQVLAFLGSLNSEVVSYRLEDRAGGGQSPGGR